MFNNKYSIATIIAAFFHLVGLVGILFFDKAFFIAATPVNLLLSFILILFTQGYSVGFSIFAITTALLGFAAEAIGVNTGILFGNYVYGEPLGYQLFNVPLLIGINWVIVIYCSGVTINHFISAVVKNIPAEKADAVRRAKAISIVVDGALLAALFDYLMEPVAVKLGYWQWLTADGIPIYNYICWYVISAALLLIFQSLPFNKKNKFAIHLLLIQAMFFLVLRTFLN